MSNQIQNPNVKIFNKYLIIFFITGYGLLVTGYFALAASDSFNVGLTVDEEAASAVCDNDGNCDSGETASNCPNDCGCNNDGACQSARGETTANCPNDCAVEEDTGGGSVGGMFDPPDTQAPSIYDIEVSNITLTSAVLSWKTTESAKSTLYLGQTIDYEIALVSESDFSREHSVFVDQLFEDTLYNFKITAVDSRDNSRETLNRDFSTLTPPDLTPPPNVDDFIAEGQDQKVNLDWQNPVDDDFEEVLIIKSEDFYPQKPWEGAPVYAGKEPIIEDKDVENEKTYYYTAFSFDKKGNFSSGAIAKATPRKPGLPPIEPGPPIEPPVEPAPPEVEKLEIGDFRFFQAGEEIFILEDNQLYFDSESPITALIEYEKVPEVLKTIMFTLEKDSKYFSFLLRVNQDKTEYTATLQPPAPGLYPMSIYVLDYKNQALKKMNGFFKVKEALPAQIVPFDQGNWFQKASNWLWLLLFLLLGFILGILYKKHRDNRFLSDKRYYNKG